MSGVEPRHCVVLRRARATDSGLVLSWRNDPFIVSRSTSARTVSAEEHERWIAKAVADPACLFSIVEAAGVPVGQVRVERKDAEECVISVYLLEKHTGKGIGLTAIRLAAQAAWAAWPIRRIVALVRDDNVAGQRAFASAGFQRAGAAVDVPFHSRFVLPRPA